MALDFVAGCIGGKEDKDCVRKFLAAGHVEMSTQRKGCAGILVGHPLDTVKVRIQTQDFYNPQYKGTFDCFRSIIRQEKFSGLYKGMSSPLAGVAVINAIVFGVYGNLQKNLQDSQSLSSHFLAGSVAGVLQSFICSPMELAKTRSQLQKTRKTQNPFQCLRQISKVEGFKGIFRGLNLTLLREGWGFGVYFSVYEWLTRTEDTKTVGTVHLLAAGGSSGAASWLVTYPLDVLKSRIQADGMSGEKLYKNSVDCLMKSVQTEGVSCLFRGLCPTLVRAFPTNAATWAVVTWIMRLAKTEAKLQETEQSLSFLSDCEPPVTLRSYDLGFRYDFHFNCLTEKFLLRND